MKLTNVARWFFASSFALAIGLTIQGCGGTVFAPIGGTGPTNGANGGYHFNSDTINCPSSSLIIDTTGVAGFPNGSDVKFTNPKTGQTYDGGGGVATSEGLDTGLPPGTPAGTYDVTVTSPGGKPVDVGPITYTTNGCSK